MDKLQSQHVENLYDNKHNTQSYIWQLQKTDPIQRHVCIYKYIGSDRPNPVYKTRQMDKTQVVNLWSLLRYICKH
jgi:hypothetical protein